MKIIIAVCLAFAAVLVYSERCVGPMDCQLTLCVNTSKIICERQECTCAPVPTSCLSRDDCLSGSRCLVRGQDWHCVDNVCMCTF